MRIRRIFKYPLQLVRAQELELPDGYNILSIQVQEGQVCLWAEVLSDQPTVPLTLIMVGTGQTLPAVRAAQYIATVQLDGFVWHFYRRMGV